MHLRLSVIALASLLTISACGGDDDEPSGDASVKDAGGEDSGSESDSGTGDAG